MNIFTIPLQTLDKLQGWLWVAEHRLPLFLKSDLLFEYKLCKFLTSSMVAKTTPPAQGSLPSLPHGAQAIPRRHSLTSLLQNASPQHSTIPTSHSHSTLVAAKAPRDTHHRWSVSVQPATAGLPPLTSDQLCMEDFHVFVKCALTIEV